MMDKLLSLLDGMDIAALLPETGTLLGLLTFVMWILLLVGPAMMLAFGLLYLLTPPKEANYKLGFRTYFGMGSVQAWRFSQRLAGLVFGGLGLILLIVMLCVCFVFTGKTELEMATATVTCLLWQVGLAVAGHLGVSITACVLFDRNGAPRSQKKPLQNSNKS